jgi:hypothetical protein
LRLRSAISPIRPFLKRLFHHEGHEVLNKPIWTVLLRALRLFVVKIGFRLPRWVFAPYALSSAVATAKADAFRLIRSGAGESGDVKEPGTNRRNGPTPATHPEMPTSAPFSDINDKQVLPIDAKLAEPCESILLAHVFN